MFSSNHQLFWWALAVFVPISVVVILWKNSEWSLELRSLKELRFLEIDGFLAPLFLILAFPALKTIGNVTDRFDICERAYVELFVFALAISLAIGFSISAFRQTNVVGKLCAALTLLVLAIVFLLPTVSA